MIGLCYKSSKVMTVKRARENSHTILVGFVVPVIISNLGTTTFRIDMMIHESNIMIHLPENFMYNKGQYDT